MATPSSPPHSWHTDENTPINQIDPYLLQPNLSTARNLQEFVKKYMQPAVPDPPASPTGRPVTQYRRAQCTHITMVRRHGEHICHWCGRIPSVGWVYLCQQDYLPRIRSNAASTEALPLVSDQGNYFEAQAEVAKSLGMSASVIKQMRAGEYCYEQIETLLAQRRHVKEVISQAENLSSRSTPPSPERLMNKLVNTPAAESVIATAGLGISSTQQGETELLPMTPAGTPDNTPTESTSSTPAKKTVKKAKCNFQVCHACRPFIQDRVPMNVKAVINNEVPVVTLPEMCRLPVRDSNIVRNIGLREPPQETSMSPPQEPELSRVRDGNEEQLSEDSTPTTSSSVWSDVSENLSGGDAFPCPGAGACPLYSPNEGCAYDLGFDDGDRAINHGFSKEKGASVSSDQSATHWQGHRFPGPPSITSSNASSISLPDGWTAPLTPSPPSASRLGFGLGGHMSGKKIGKAATICGDHSEDTKHIRLYPFGMFGNDSSSSVGSEVEVQGGVALTEEAVRSGMPDIATDED